MVTEYLVRSLYLAGVEGDALLYLNHRLKNRKTYVDWDRTIMGPILDEHGVEQGGINSSDYYKLFNNDLLEILQSSRQGVHMGSKLTVSGVGQADDVLLCSNDIFMLYNLLQLALDFSKKFNIELSSNKTKLLMFADKTKTIALNPIQN